MHLFLGAAVYRDASGFLRLATSADASKSPAIGVVAVTGMQNFKVAVISSGFITLNNWVAAVGSLYLTPASLYYLAVAPGKLTTNAAEAGAVSTQAVGYATSSATMQILGNVSNKPPSGLTTVLSAAQDLLGNSWALNFQNGMLTQATLSSGAGGGGSASMGSLILKDSVTGNSVILTVEDGQLQLAVTDTDIGGEQISFTDSVTGKTVIMTVQDGQLQLSVQ